MTDLIDPDELPFTTAEIYEAACRFLPEHAARELAAHLTEIAPGYMENRAQRRSQWRQAGIPNADALSLHGWVYPDELLPALASLGMDAKARALRILEADWGSCYQADVQYLRQAAAERAGTIPSREEILRRVERAKGSDGDGGRMPNMVGYRLPPLPLPTGEMEATAEERRSEQRRRFEATVARFSS